LQRQKYRKDTQSKLVIGIVAVFVFGLLGFPIYQNFFKIPTPTPLTTPTATTQTQATVQPASPNDHSRSLTSGTPGSLIANPRASKVDYKQLEDFLAAKNWKQADKETLAVMLKVAGREKESWLDDQSIKNFSCSDLRTIDQLWIKYSNDRFGFSVQKRIWESIGKDYGKFGDRVGWRVNETWIANYDVTYNTLAREGHLPTISDRFISQIAPDNATPNSTTLLAQIQRDTQSALNTLNAEARKQEGIIAQKNNTITIISSLSSRLKTCNIQ
jgi:GUN4-like